ncbi:Hypothetical protein KLENKIAIHU_4545, partial [Klenkia terrae]
VPTTRRLPVGAVATLVAACAAVAVLAAGTALTASPTAPEDLAVLVWVLGWVLVVWTAVAVAAGLVGLVRAGTAGRRPARGRVVAVLAATAVLAGGVLAHPVAGSGGATAPAGQESR